jgi:hypothetical protein
MSIECRYHIRSTAVIRQQAPLSHEAYTFTYLKSGMGCGKEGQEEKE